MLRNKRKVFAVIFLIIAIMSTTCLATDEAVTTSTEEPVVTSTDGTETEGSTANDTVTDEATTSEGETPADEVTDDSGNAENTDDSTESENTDGTDSQVEEPVLIEDDLYKTGDDVTISDYIDGNVYVMGGKVTVSAKIGGDLFVFANELILTEDCYTYGNLYVLAPTITINGIVCDLYAVGTDLSIGATGIVLRDARTLASKTAIDGNIGRNAFVQTNTLSMADEAHIYGNLNYTADEAIVVPSGAVEGNIEFTNSVGANVGDIIISYVWDFVYTLVYTLVIFGLLIFVAPKFTNNLYEFTKKKWLPALGIGLLVGVLIPIIAILLLFTGIGTQLSFALMALYLLVFSITFAITAVALSKLLADKFPVLGKFRGLFALLIVTLVLWGLTQIPFYVGFVISLLIAIFGLGLFVLSIFKKEQVQAE